MSTDTNEDEKDQSDEDAENDCPECGEPWEVVNFDDQGLCPNCSNDG